MAKVSKAREAFVKKQLNLMLQRVVEEAANRGIQREYGTPEGATDSQKALDKVLQEFETFIEVSMAARPEDNLGWYHKCLLCGKARADHNSTDRACPVGRPHRTLALIDVLYHRSTSRNFKMFEEYGIPYKPSTRAHILAGKGSSGALHRR